MTVTTMTDGDLGCVISGKRKTERHFVGIFARAAVAGKFVISFDEGCSVNCVHFR